MHFKYYTVYLRDWKLKRTVSSVGGENHPTINHQSVTLKDSQPRATLPSMLVIPIGRVHLCTYIDTTQRWAYLPSFTDGVPHSWDHLVFQLADRNHIKQMINHCHFRLASETTKSWTNCSPSVHCSRGDVIPNTKLSWGVSNLDCITGLDYWNGLLDCHNFMLSES